jgi:hypothetical protein
VNLRRCDARCLTFAPSHHGVRSLAVYKTYSIVHLLPLADTQYHSLLEPTRPTAHPTSHHQHLTFQLSPQYGNPQIPVVSGRYDARMFHRRPLRIRHSSLLLGRRYRHMDLTFPQHIGDWSSLVCWSVRDGAADEARATETEADMGGISNWKIHITHGDPRWNRNHRETAVSHYALTRIARRMTLS